MKNSKTMLGTKKKQMHTITVLAAVSVLCASVCGYLYCMHFSDFMREMVLADAGNSLSLAQEDLAGLLRYLSGVMVLYYMTMTVLTCLMVWHRRRSVRTVLFFMAALKLAVLALMLAPNPSFAFHCGFEILPEAVLLIHVARLSEQRSTLEETLPHLNIIVPAGILIELIPLLRNVQCLTSDSMSIWGKAGFVLLPVAMMAVFFTLGLYQLQPVRRPRRRPAPVIPLKQWHMALPASSEMVKNA